MENNIQVLHVNNNTKILKLNAQLLKREDKDIKITNETNTREALKKLKKII